MFRTYGIGQQSWPHTYYRRNMLYKCLVYEQDSRFDG